MPELGDAVALEVVRLQAGDVSAVDDLVPEGIAPPGETHRAPTAVRRDPQLTAPRQGLRQAKTVT